jgi:hypothetical protein
LMTICSMPCSSLLWRIRSVVDANPMVFRRIQPMPCRARTSSKGSDRCLFYYALGWPKALYLAMSAPESIYHRGR